MRFVLGGVLLKSTVGVGEKKKVMPRMAGAMWAVDSSLSIVTRAIPVANERHVVIQVAAAGVNRADVLQRMGSYPAPPGVTDILGLECAGRILSLGAGVTGGLKVGDRVMALLRGGGYAQYVSAHECCVVKVPDGIDLQSAAAIPEVWTTAYQLLQRVANVKPAERVMVHAAGSGVGLAAVQMASIKMGAEVIATAGSAKKLEACRKLGARNTINYKTTPDFAQAVRENSIDVILDCIGASYWKQNLRAIAVDGRWVLYGTLGGNKVPEVNLGVLLAKRINLLASTLRSRSNEYQGGLIKVSLFHDQEQRPTSLLYARTENCYATTIKRLLRLLLKRIHTFSKQSSLYPSPKLSALSCSVREQALEQEIVPDIDAGILKITIDSTFLLDQVSEAHSYIESNSTMGKIILVVNPDII